MPPSAASLPYNCQRIALALHLDRAARPHNVCPCLRQCQQYFHGLSPVSRCRTGSVVLICVALFGSVDRHAAEWFGRKVTFVSAAYDATFVFRINPARPGGERLTISSPRPRALPFSAKHIPRHPTPPWLQSPRSGATLSTTGIELPGKRRP